MTEKDKVTKTILQFGRSSNQMNIICDFSNQCIYGFFVALIIFCQFGFLLHTANSVVQLIRQLNQPLFFSLDYQTNPSLSALHTPEIFINNLAHFRFTGIVQMNIISVISV